MKTGRAPDKASLDAKHLEVLSATENLTGARCETCPQFYAWLPWVHDAASARRWRDKGQLRERVGWPSVSLVRAIDLLDASSAARERYEFEQRDKERKAAAEEAKRAT
jgi:hypothetical protein